MTPVLKEFSTEEKFQFKKDIKDLITKVEYFIKNSLIFLEDNKDRLLSRKVSYNSEIRRDLKLLDNKVLHSMDVDSYVLIPLMLIDVRNQIAVDIKYLDNRVKI